mgnify:CR=1 FL=1
MGKKNNQISLKKAIKWTERWREKCPNNCKAFSIPVQDMVAVLKEIGVIQEAGNTGLYVIDEKTPNGVRAYMAIDPALEGEPGGGEKIILVGTEPQIDFDQKKVVQRDIINGKLDNKGPFVDPKNSLLGEDEIDTGIYDFSQPCPNFCDFESPLANGHI